MKRYLVSILIVLFLGIAYFYFPAKVIEDAGQKACAPLKTESQKLGMGICYNAPSVEQIENIKWVHFFNSFPYHSSNAQYYIHWFNYGYSRFVTDVKLNPITDYLKEEYLAANLDTVKEFKNIQPLLAIDTFYEDSVVRHYLFRKRALERLYNEFKFNSSSMLEFPASDYLLDGKEWWKWFRNRKKLDAFCECWIPYRDYFNEYKIELLYTHGNGSAHVTGITEFHPLVLDCCK